ncbi:hypothetical protein NECID01_1677 [Nematocida sp. AWRm77]|nr:hypothetical protein NECID01_1677 [Nematocida sp. AWRm77]
MKKIAAYLVVCTLAMLCLCTATIEVNFKLVSEKESFICTVPRGAFRKIDRQEKDNLVSALDQSSFAPNKECKFSLSKICTHEQYKHFKAFWETDLAALSAEEDNALLQYQTDLTSDLFDRFLHTADYLEIQGEYAKCFAQNMVQYGLLGQHSEDITDPSQCKDKALSYNTFEPMLSAFLKQIGFVHKTIVHPSTGQTVLKIEKADVWTKKINKEYTGPSQTTRMQAVLYSELGLESSQEKQRNEAVLGWLLQNMNEFSVDIQYFNKVVSDNISELSQTIQNFTKENKTGPCVYVEGLTLIVCHRHYNTLSRALQLVPDLSRLELFITPPYTSNLKLSSLFSTITLCKSLKELKIRGVYLDSVLVSSLVESIPGIEQLSLWCDPLEATAIDSFKNCTHLESLEVDGKPQPSAVVQALVSQFPFLRELSINCDVLESISAESFKTCSQLEKLKMYGESQPNTVVQALVRHLPFLIELRIECEVLKYATIESFKTCTQLEKLKIFGEGSIYCLIRLLEVLPFLQYLRITIDAADLPLANALRNSFNLHSLNLTVRQYTPGFLALYLQRPFPSLAHLKLYNYDQNNNYSEEDSSALKEAGRKKINILLETGL